MLDMRHPNGFCIDWLPSNNIQTRKITSRPSEYQHYLLGNYTRIVSDQYGNR